jgi:hypothetical protein
VLRELLTAGAVPRVTRWQPVVAGWSVTGGVLLWWGDDVHDAPSTALLLRAVALLLVLGVVSLLDDAAAGLLGAAPRSLPWRGAVRVALAAAAVALPWCGALLWVRPERYGVPPAGLTLECAALTAFGLAVAAGVGRWSDTGDPGLAAGPALFGGALVASALPPSLSLYTLPGDGWNAAHQRWFGLLVLCLVVLGVALRDPAGRLRRQGCRRAAQPTAPDAR